MTGNNHTVAAIVSPIVIVLVLVILIAVWWCICKRRRNGTPTNINGPTQHGATYTPTSQNTSDHSDGQVHVKMQRINESSADENSADED